MNRFYLFFIPLILFYSLTVSAQVDTPLINQPYSNDSLYVPDSIAVKDSSLQIQMADSFSRKPFVQKDSGWMLNPSIPLSIQVLQHHPYLGYNSKPVSIRSNLKKVEGKETLFYVLVGLVLLFALLRNAFPKYFSDLFKLFFRTTLKQRQIREQLMQTPLPSLLFNGFFIVSGGLYADFMLLHFQLIEKEDFWPYFFYCSTGLSCIYLVKFIGLKVLGWIFNLRNAADSYVFIVFIVNKVIGIFLLPFLILLAFVEGTGYTVALVLSWVGVCVLFFYRFILTYAAVRNQVRFNIFHFFLYLCAFEIAPLLLIYKLLLVFFQ
ncbi:MAG TPA: DUF4271 domain-containing protein [Chitinophagaceae bacterium]